jgi:cardiolipin synthase
VRFSPARLANPLSSDDHEARTARLNDEVNLNVFDTSFSRKQVEIFEADKRRSERVRFEQWKRRPWPAKTKNWPVALFRREL